MWQRVFLLSVTLGLLCASVAGFALPSMMASSPGPVAPPQNTQPSTRRDMLATIATVVSSASFATAASAKGVDPAKVGTKEDPEFQTCLSNCMYFCTKPKLESRTRSECLPECKKQCATTKAQAITGVLK
ncbi:unnamed protein product [Chrysoparadoxa australica]